MIDRGRSTRGGRASAKSEPPAILDQHGRPWESNGDGKLSRKSAVRMMKTFAGYVQRLYGLDHDPVIRARDPYGNHAWVYAAATVTARNIAQAPLGVWIETEEELQSRALRAKRAGRPWTGPRAGRSRTAVARHLRWKGRKFGFFSKGLEPDPEHEMSVLFANPNPQMTGQQLIEATVLWLQLRGESFWLLTKEGGERIAPGETPGEIWPLRPDQFKAVKKRGRLVGWKVAVSTLEGFEAPTEVLLDLHEVVQFKFTNPADPVRGMSPISAAAAGITIDMLATSHNKSILENGAEPSGVIAFDDGFSDQDEEDRFLEKWENRHQGPSNRGRLSLLAGSGAKYFQVGLSPADMQYLEQRRWDRDEILAVEGVPKAMLSITDDLNYATALGQKRTFWDELLFPIIRMIEDVLDGTLLRPETDNIIAAFDLSGVEALKIGLEAKTNDAKALSGTELHMPPEMAFEIVGLDVAKYEGSDVALVSPLLAPVGDVISGLGPLPGGDEGDEGGGDGGEEPAPEDETPAGPLGKQSSRARGQRIWRALMRGVQEPLERLFANAWKRWLRAERTEQLARFDEVAGASRSLRAVKQDELDMAAVLLDVGEMQQRLGGAVRPLYSNALDAVFGFTVEELGGIPVFSIDDPRIMSFFDAHQRRLVGSTPVTIQENLRRSMSEGLLEGETLGQLRQRVAEVYNVAGSDWKTLQVARTETAGFMNGARNAMFEAQGFKSAEWVTAGDEEVRENHAAFGNLGPRPLTHDFLADRVDPTTGTGRLQFPNDPLGPAAEVINCRCIHIPSAE